MEGVEQPINTESVSGDSLVAASGIIGGVGMGGGLSYYANVIQRTKE